MGKISNDEVANIFKKLVDDGDEDFIDTIKEIIKKKSDLSSRKMASILGTSKSFICNLRNWKEKSAINVSPRRKNWPIWFMAFLPNAISELAGNQLPE